MEISELCLLHLFLCLYFIPIIICQSDYRYNLCSNTNGNYTNSSIYKANINTLLDSISSETNIYTGFYNISVGQDPNIVNGIALCRGDLLEQDCHACLKNAAHDFPALCPTQKEAVVWYETCMLRYSNQILSGISDNFSWHLNNPSFNFKNGDKFNEVLRKLLSSLQGNAASGDSQLKFATGQDNVYNVKLYALAQCTPDLSYKSCFNCIGNCIDLLPRCCDNRQGARVSCKKLRNKIRDLPVL